MQAECGFTLWELLLTTAITGVVAGLGVPALQWLALDMRLTADTNSLVAAVQFARSEAAKRRSTVVMCNSVDGLSCATGSARFESGWIVFVNSDADRPPVPDPGEPVLLQQSPTLAGTIRSNRTYFEFRPFMRRSTNGTVTLCDARGATSARAVIVSYTGRPRTVTAARRQLSCPIQ